MDYLYLILVLPAVIFSLWASIRVNTTFKKYSKIRSMRGITGAEAARRVLDANGLQHIRIEQIPGNLTDHYDPRTRTLRLSDATYNSTSVAALGVAAHECGHAIQDQKQYGPLVLRSTLVPAANIGSQLSWPIFFAGLIFSIQPLVTAGIILFCLAVLFQLVTLPVEFNASSRALEILDQGGILGSQEMDGARKVLRAAAMTYVAALASSLLQLLRLILIARRNDRD